MPRLVAVATAQPPHKVSQDQARDFAARVFADRRADLQRLLPVFDNAQIERRRFCEPLEWFTIPHTFREKNEAFVRHALPLVTEAVESACTAGSIEPPQLDHIFLVTTTGFATPSLDAHLLNRLPLSPGIVRTPIWGLGCAGGVAALGRAHDWLLAYPSRLAVVVAVELCGLTFVHSDHSKSNFVATALFGDGCGAALLAGRDHPAGGRAPLLIEGAACHTWPSTLDVMGWDFSDDGLHVIFSTSIPHLVAARSRPPVDRFLASHGLRMAEVGAFLSHPGGAKVIEAFQEAFSLSVDAAASMRSALREHGNMSSATVFHVLEHFLNSGLARSGMPILSTALGPGFSMEMVLGRCA